MEYERTIDDEQAVPVIKKIAFPFIAKKSSREEIRSIKIAFK